MLCSLYKYFLFLNKDNFILVSVFLLRLHTKMFQVIIDSGVNIVVKYVDNDRFGTSFLILMSGRLGFQIAIFYLHCAILFEVELLHLQFYYNCNNSWISVSQVCAKCNQVSGTNHWADISWFSNDLNCNNIIPLSWRAYRIITIKILVLSQKVKNWQCWVVLTRGDQKLDKIFITKHQHHNIVIIIVDQLKL